MAEYFKKYLFNLNTIQWHSVLTYSKSLRFSRKSVHFNIGFSLTSCHPLFAGNIIEGFCVHPLSRPGRNVHSPSNPHNSSGSTVSTFLTQIDIDQQNVDFDILPAVAEEDSDSWNWPNVSVYWVDIIDINSCFGHNKNTIFEKVLSIPYSHPKRS